ncbi:tetratricopeptide repeat protein [Desulfonatronum thioautotrophicum]|uniref:tetratricopeptide repeat protein n=1 Tax=Desulfonatronum thioautotrophicum TaxID=617001 RepID=UPI001294707E|nr:tetratricopeptide repeat protein [Desulfonatronum thioautotrophicum]
MKTPPVSPVPAPKANRAHPQPVQSASRHAGHHQGREAPAQARASNSAPGSLLPAYVIATSNDVNFEQDRENLRRLGMIMNCRLTSAGAVLDFIRHNSIQTIILDSSVSGCNLPDLIFQIRKYLRATPLNMLVISDISAEHFVVDVITAGCTGFIIRPYTLDTLKRHMRIKPEADAIHVSEELLAQGQSLLATGDYEAAIGEFKEIVAEKESEEGDEARRYFEMGMQYLLERKFGKAIVAFNNALRLNSLFIKAYEGLAEAYHGRGDMRNYQVYLQKAADEYARMDQFAEVKRVFAKITKQDIHAPNAYNTLGIELRHKKLYAEAVHAYINALKLSPQDENIYYNLAKAQMFAKLFDDALSSIRRCLELNADHSEALDLYRLFTKVDWNDDKTAKVAENNKALNQIAND